MILILIQNLFSGGGDVCVLQTVKALELTLGELYISMYPSQRKYFELHWAILFQLCVLLVKQGINQAADMPRML
jgi:hypothetical protein